jgi:hypothetical protein
MSSTSSTLRPIAAAPLAGLLLLLLRLARS